MNKYKDAISERMRALHLFQWFPTADNLDTIAHFEQKMQRTIRMNKWKTNLYSDVIRNIQDNSKTLILMFFHNSSVDHSSKEFFREMKRKTETAVEL